MTLVDAYDRSLRARRYAWNGALVSLDKAKAVVTVSAPVEEHVFRYVDRVPVQRPATRASTMASRTLAWMKSRSRSSRPGGTNRS